MGGFLSCNKTDDINIRHKQPKIKRTGFYKGVVYKLGCDYIRIFDYATIVVKNNNILSIFQLDNIDINKFLVLSKTDKADINNSLRYMVMNYINGIYIGYTGVPPFSEYSSDNGIILYYIDNVDLDNKYVDKSEIPIDKIDMCVNINEIISNKVESAYMKIINKSYCCL